MNELQIFENEEFGSIRVVEINNEPWFVGRDVAEALGYMNTRQAIATNVDDEDRGVHSIDTLSGTQKMTIINESGLYSLILQSKLDSAKKFKRWIISVVIPSIRKNGGYIANQENLSPEQIVANALIVAQNIIAARDKQIAELKPKAEFFDAVTDSKDAIPMADVAKVLDMGIGRNKLFEFLRDKKILMADNRPYQKFIDAGYFRVVEQKFDKGFGEVGINIKTLVFQKRR
jgi:prophage antirepressor-like protein